MVYCIFFAEIGKRMQFCTFSNKPCPYANTKEAIQNCPNLCVSYPNELEKKKEETEEYGG